jgi:hypothetical protein
LQHITINKKRRNMFWHVTLRSTRKLQNFQAIYYMGLVLHLRSSHCRLRGIIHCKELKSYEGGAKPLMLIPSDSETHGFVGQDKNKEKMENEEKEQ